MNNVFLTEEFKTDEKKRRRREIIIILSALLGLIAFAFFEKYLFVILTRLNIPKDFFSKIMFLSVVNLNLILILVLVFLLFRNIVKLVLEVKRGKLGANLRTKLVVVFLFFSVIPTVLLFYISTQFINNSIEKYFSEMVDEGLDEAKKVVQYHYDDAFKRLSIHSSQFSERVASFNYIVSDSNPRFMQIFRKYMVDHNFSVSKIYVVEKGGVVSISDESIFLPKDVWKVDDSEGIARAKAGEFHKSIVKLKKGELLTYYQPIMAFKSPEQISAILVSSIYINLNILGELDKVSSMFQKLNPGKGVLKSGYFVLLVVMTLLIVFSGVWLGFYLARQITIPIAELADATGRIADGDLDFTISIDTTDEFGTLIRAFNKMTTDLKASRTELDIAYNDLAVQTDEAEKGRRYMEAVLIHVRAGVISIGADGLIQTINKAAASILQIEALEYIGKSFKDVILSAEHRDITRDLLEELSTAPQEFIQKNIQITIGEKDYTILVSVEVLREDSGKYLGMVVVFDDMTEIVKAQRAAAWREVARRIAHEIKNPLTPIKLSAQRLLRKFGHQYTGQDLKVFEECTKAIVEQVDDLKILVDEFSKFARLPAAHPKLNNMHEIMEEMIHMYQDNHPNIKFEYNDLQKIPQFMFDKEQIKRVFINLINNAISAISGTGEIHILSEFNEVLQIARITISDDGKGISREEKAKLFEPYFSTKRSGTGLGLSIVNQIIADHQGYIRFEDNVPKGAKFILEFPVNYDNNIKTNQV